MKWKKASKAAAAVLPTLGTALAGPKGAVVGTILSKALSVPENPDNVKAALKAPENRETIIKTVTDNVTTINHAAHVAELAKARLYMRLGAGAVLTGVLLLGMFVTIPEQNAVFVSQILGTLQATVEYILVQ
jgi:hypothetical protein